MELYSYKGHTPKVGKNCFIAPNATLIGDVTIEDGANVWFNSVLRGDMSPIVVGKNTNIQDLCMLHVDTPSPCIIGENVTIGHHVVLHGCKIGNSCLIGMGAVILNNAEVGDNCLVAAGTVVAPGKKYPPGSFILGVPGRVKSELPKDRIDYISNRYEIYTKLTEEYSDPNVVKRIQSQV